MAGKGWQPRTFQEAVARVHGNTGAQQGIDSLGISLRVSGAKACPAPEWDSRGTYRIALVGDKAVIEKLGLDNQWTAAELQPPSEPAKERRMGIETRTRNILFMDVSGWSKLGAHEIHAYVTAAMPALCKHLKGDDFRNTWGDAIVATFDSAKNAAESALNIRDFFVRALPIDGIASGLTCRIALHQGEVIVCENALTNNTKDIFGDAVHLAARLEPMTAPGHVYCTEAFAKALASVEKLGPRTWPLGELTLPKNFGTVNASVVTWTGEADPTPGLKVASASDPTTAKEAAVTSSLAEDDAPVALRGWLNKLDTNKSGEAIEFSDVDRACKLPPGCAARILPDVVVKAGLPWSVQEKGGSVIILSYKHAPAFITNTRSRRGY